MRHPSPCNTTERRPIKTGPVRGGGRRTIYWTSVDFLKKNVKSRYRVTMVVAHLGFLTQIWGFPLAGGLLVQLPTARQEGGTSQI